MFAYKSRSALHGDLCSIGIPSRDIVMWRSFFLAIGAYCCLLGVEALAVEKAVLKRTPTAGYMTSREVVPPDWAPWSLLGTGAVVVLYSFTVPQRVGGG
jgi:hypothetical protein